jgi:hypothetical protein
MKPRNFIAPNFGSLRQTSIDDFILLA